MSQKAHIGSLFLLLALLGQVVGAAELPDAEINTTTGNIESVDAPFANSYQVRHIVDPGQGGNRTSVTLSSHAAASPRIAVDSGGASWVVWWQDSATDRIYYRRHDLSGASWSVEKAISTPSEQSRYPEIVHDGNAAWIAYQIDTGVDTDLAVVSIIDAPEPVGARIIVATSPTVGDLDIQLHSESGELWITWIDDSDDVGWIEYDATSESWSATLYESYAGSDVDSARSEVRDIVLGL